jgi:hypothetical protein
MDYQFSEIGDYLIHSTSLMVNIPFELAAISPEQIDSSIFHNDSETKLSFETNVNCQNYLTTKYVGRAPLEFYGPKTKMGREFVLKCKDGDPSYACRAFGTEDAMKGYNRSANENIVLPKGG